MGAELSEGSAAPSNERAMSMPQFQAGDKGDKMIARDTAELIILIKGCRQH